MSMTMLAGKSLSFDDPITLDGRVEYTDQNGNSTLLDMKKYVSLAKKSKDKEYFSKQIEWIEKGELTIGAFIISGMNRLAIEFPKEVGGILKE